MDRVWKMSLLMVAIILVDQFTKGAIVSNFQLGEVKEVIPGFFNLTYVRNYGIAFGIGQTYPDWVRIIAFKIVPILACFFFLYLVWDTRYKSFRLCLAYSMIFAGAVGNIMDRVSMDYVVDMFDFYYGSYHYYTFNVADAAISVAAAIYIFDYILELKNGGSIDESEEIKKGS